jgi:leucine dehydrogenase
VILEDLIAGWDGEETVIRFDRPTGTWMFICVHSTVLGPAGGGTRMATYPAPADGLADAMRLSAAMTRKMAVLGTPFGGGKAVLAVPRFRRASSAGACCCATGTWSLRWAGRTGPRPT